MTSGWQLSFGQHAPGSGRVCVIEAWAVEHGQGHTDHPAGIDTVIADLLRLWNDGFRFSDNRTTQLARYVTRDFPAGDAERDIRRLEVAAAWLTGVALPFWAEQAGMPDAFVIPLRTVRNAEDVEAAVSSMRDAVNDHARLPESAWYWSETDRLLAETGVLVARPLVRERLRSELRPVEQADQAVIRLAQWLRFRHPVRFADAFTAATQSMHGLVELLALTP